MSDFWMRLVAALSLTIVGGFFFGFVWTVGSTVFREWRYDQADRQAKKDGWASFKDQERWEDAHRW